MFIFMPWRVKLPVLQFTGTRVFLLSMGFHLFHAPDKLILELESRSRKGRIPPDIVAATVMCTSINRDNSLYETVSRIVDENIILSHNPTPQSKMHLMNNSVIFLRGLEGMKEESHRILRALQYLVCGFVAINIVSVALFWWSLHAIIRCLN